jgi:hypothetical protein
MILEKGQPSILGSRKNFFVFSGALKSSYAGSVANRWFCPSASPKICSFCYFSDPVNFQIMVE